MFGISQRFVVCGTPPNSGKFPGFGPAASVCQCRSLKPARHEVFAHRKEPFPKAVSIARLCVAGLWQVQTGCSGGFPSTSFFGPSTWKWLFSVVKNIMPSRLQGPALADTGSWPKSWEFPRVWWCPAHHQTLGNSQPFLGRMEALVVPGLHDSFMTGLTFFHV